MVADWVSLKRCRDRIGVCPDAIKKDQAACRQLAAMTGATTAATSLGSAVAAPEGGAKAAMAATS